VLLIALLLVPSAWSVAPTAAHPTSSASAPPALTSTPTTPAAPSSSSLTPIPGTNPGLDTPIPNFSTTVRAWSLHSLPPSTSTSGSAPRSDTFSSTATGWFTGYVMQSTSPTTPVTGVTVQAFSVATSSPCSPSVCTAQSTGGTGYFNVTAPVGIDYITFQVGDYAENLTYATCLVNTTVDVGTVLLVPDGYVIGTVRADVTGLPTMSGVQVQGEGRDSGVISQPTVYSNTSGGFKVPVPPGVAAKVLFTPPAPVGGSPNFQNNFTWVSVGAGETVNISTVYIEPFAVVKAEIYDVVTNTPINNQYAAMEICSLQTTACGPQGVTVEDGHTLFASGPTGYDEAQVDVSGYVQNITPIGFVPGSTSAHPQCVPNNCRIYLMPEGAVSVKVSISLGNKSNTLWADSQGLVTVSASSLNGFFGGVPVLNPTTGTFNMSATSTLPVGCGPVGSTISAPALPLRDRIDISPDTAGECTGFPTWPIPSDLPVYDNWTVANVTPYETTAVGWLNLTPGVYIEGDVFVQGTDQAPAGGFTVGVSSLISTTLTSYPWAPPQALGPCPYPPLYQFCVPAPPGPDKLTVSAVGYAQNFSMVDVPWAICCVNAGAQAEHGPLSLWAATDPHINSINVSAGGELIGSVILAGGTEPVPNAALTVCPAGSDEAAVCGDGIANASGGYDIPNIPTGWNYVTAVGSGDEVNGEWVDIVGTVTAAPIPLQPLARLSGLVESANGTPLIDASITYCPVDGANAAGICTTSLGAGVTQSDGAYFGLVAGGWLPWSTYEIQASAPGYVSDWTFVNATQNTTTYVPTIYLQPVGINTTQGAVARGAVHAIPGPVQPNIWVVGRLVDNVTGVGVSVQTLSACPVSNPTNCLLFSDGTNTGGFFNASIPTGSYNLTATAPGYYSLLVPINAVSLPTLDLGTIDMQPLDWIQGNVSLGPWTTIEVNLSASSHVFVHLVPPTNVNICTQQQVCTSATPSGTGGDFEVQSYSGDYLVLEASPIYNGGPNSATGGVRYAQIPVNITPGQAWIPTAPVLDVFGLLTGTVWNSASYNPVTGNYTDPARWVSITASTSGYHNNGIALATTNGAGAYTVALPGGNKAGATNITATDLGMFYSNTTRVWPEYGPGQNLTITVPGVSLVQYGFAVGTFVDSVTGVAIPNIGISATVNDAKQNLYGSSSSESNLGGFVNMTAPSATVVDFSAGGADDYNGTSFTATVVPGAATNLTGPNASVAGLIPLPHWGWVASPYVDYNAPLNYSGTILDSTNHQPLPLTNVQISTPDLTIATGGTALPSNTLGEFLADAPIGPKDQIEVTHAGYVNNDTLSANISANQMLTVGTINLTGYGVVAGRVVSTPGTIPVVGAVVTVCPGTSEFSPDCTSTVTNSTGWYWITAVPGHDSLTASATGFVSNYTQPLIVSPDSWQRAPDFILIKDGLIYGVVLGFPEALGLGGAQVAACSPLGGTPTGPCLFSVGSAANGSFALALVPGQFILAVTMADFNSSYLPVYVPAGGVVNVGNVYLNEYGIVSGTVIDSATNDPIYNATVNGCPVYAYLACDTTAHTDLSGQYHLASPPGAVSITVTDPGFNTGYLTVSAVSGKTVVAPTVALIPLSTQLNFAVTGRVVAAGSSTGLAGAVVSFRSGPSIAASAETGPDGSFSAQVSAGVYNVVATDPGYASANQTVHVSSSVEGLVFPLSVFAWPVTVTVVDGLTHLPIPGAAIWSPSALLGWTDAQGEFRAMLPNGTYDLTAQGNVSAHLPYESSAAVVSVIGSPSSRMIDLYPPTAQLGGEVLAQASDTGLGGVTVSVVGAAIDGAPATPSVVTSGTGAFSLSLYAGTYMVTVNAPGYQPWSENVSLNGSAVSLTIGLQSASATTASSSGTDWTVGVVGVVLVGVAITAAVVFGRRGGRNA